MHSRRIYSFITFIVDSGGFLCSIMFLTGLIAQIFSKSLSKIGMIEALFKVDSQEDSNDKSNDENTTEIVSMP